MTITNRVRVDIIRPYKQPEVYVKQGDIDSRVIVYELYNGQSPWTIPAGTLAEFHAKKPDNTFADISATVSGNNVTVTLDEQVTAVGGAVFAEVTLTNGDDVLSTFTHVIKVQPRAVPDDAIESEVEITAYREIVSQMTDILDDAEDARDAAQNLLDQMMVIKGSPLVAATVAEMTDTDRVYVYTGSEAGYTAGSWYYYDGDSWEVGGVYNSVAVQTDASLSVEGMAADAKATGDEISELKSDVGDKAQLNTDDKTNLVSAINEVNGHFLDGIEQGVADWLDEHPEATTTVEDNSIGPSKLTVDAVTVNTWRGASSINNFSGNTLEEKLQDFFENATSGDKLDLQGAKITITERFTKAHYTALNNTEISNGIFDIPASIGGWLSIGAIGGYRVPLFNNCVFTGGGSIFYQASYNFKAVGCTFYDVQIINDGYVQACSLTGCNIMNTHNYLIECDYAIGVALTDCTFEAGNIGIFKGDGDASRASLTYGTFVNCLIEGLTDIAFRTHGIRSADFTNCYVEKIPYLIYDTTEYADQFYVKINGGFIDNRQSDNTYTIYTAATYPSLIVNNLYFEGSNNRYLSNLTNYRKQITTDNFGEKYLYGANSGKNEIIKNNYAFNGTEFSFSTNRTSMYSQPQAFLVIVASYSATPTLLTKVSLLTLNYKPSTNGYTVTETPLVTNSLMSSQITWTASADDVLGLVTVTGTATSAVSISVVNLGTTMSGLIT